MSNRTADPAPAANKRWGGKQPDFTPKRRAALRDLRAWERHPNWDRDRRDRAVCQSWTFVRYRLEAGKLRPYAAPPTVRDGLRGPRRLSPTAVRVLELLVGLRVGYGLRVVVGDHGQLAAILGCSERWAGEALRELATAGLVERRTHFRPAGLGHAQLACSWRVARAAIRLLGAQGKKSREAAPLPSRDSGCSLTGGSSIHPNPDRAGSGVSVGAPQALKRLERDLQRQVLRGVDRARRVYAEAAREHELARSALPPPPAPGRVCSLPRPRRFHCLECDELLATVPS